MNYPIERMPHQWRSKLKRVEYGPNGLKRRPKVEAYKRKGMSAWAWLVIALMGVFILAYASCAEAGQVSAKTKARLRYVDSLIENSPTSLPKDVIRAVFWAESGWKQWNPDGTCFRAGNDYGVAQLNRATIEAHPSWSFKLIKRSAKYNVARGIELLEEKYAWAKSVYGCKKEYASKHGRYGLLGNDEIDVAIRAYNGMNESQEYLDLVNKYLMEKPWEKYLE